MTNKLISLVIIIFILSIGHSYSEEEFLFPKEKPSIFKKINKDPGKSFSSNLPQKKPLTNQEEEQKKNVSQKQKVVVEDKKVELEKPKTSKKQEGKQLNFFKLLLVFIISFVAFVLTVDTFIVKISEYVPFAEKYLDNLYQSIIDISLFFQNLIK